MLYSANNYDSASHAMSYATCQSAAPVRTCPLARPAIASNGSALGPGGGSFFEDAGDRWLTYHAWTAPDASYASGGGRSLRIDRVAFDNGVLALKPAVPKPAP